MNKRLALVLIAFLLITVASAVILTNRATLATMANKTTTVTAAQTIIYMPYPTPVTIVR